jgi:hypothetical protein
MERLWEIANARLVLEDGFLWEKNDLMLREYKLGYHEGEIFPPYWNTT